MRLLAIIALLSLFAQPAFAVEGKLCVATGGKFLTLQDCPVCPKDAVCEKCFTGCSCPAGAIYDEKTGCTLKAK